MKKAVCLFFLCLLLSSCQAITLKKLGYTKEEISVISSLDKDGQALFTESYRDDLVALLDNPDFDNTKFNDYLSLIPQFTCADSIYIINNSLQDSCDLDKLAELFNHELFIRNKLEDYLHFINDFSVKDLLFMVNGNLLNYQNKDKLLAIMEDKYYINDNLALYLDYYDNFTKSRNLVEYVNTLRYLPDYSTDYITDTSKGNLMIVNKYYALPDGYVPDNLVSVPEEYGNPGMKLTEECFEAYKQMYNAALNDGMDLYINSSYRSYNTQVNTYNNFLTKDSQEVVDTYSARPSHSEHQTGLAIDILSPGYDFGTIYYADEVDWLAENAWKYGFILRYPDGKMDITGYKFEPWHYRYVGDLAEDIYNSGLTYDEYYAYYLK